MRAYREVRMLSVAEAAYLGVGKLTRMRSLTILLATPMHSGIDRRWHC